MLAVTNIVQRTYEDLHRPAQGVIFVVETGDDLQQHINVAVGFVISFLDARLAQSHAINHLALTQLPVVYFLRSPACCPCAVQADPDVRTDMESALNRESNCDCAASCDSNRARIICPLYRLYSSRAHALVSVHIYHMHRARTIGITLRSRCTGIG